MSSAAEEITAPEEFVLYSEADGVVTLTLNRPDELNALSQGMLDALQEQLDAISESDTARVVILAGAGRAFCAGHNLKEMRTNYTLDFQRDLLKRCSKMMLTLTQMPQPVIARVHALATAAGAQLVATADLAVATEDARFATSGINLGLFCSTPGVALARNLSRKHAMEMLLTGDFISAERAYEMGLVNRVVAADELDDCIHGLASKLAAKSRHALALGKRGFYRQIDMELPEAYEYASRVMAENMMDRDAAEGIDAFTEKRPACWDQERRD